MEGLVVVGTTRMTQSTLSAGVLRHPRSWAAHQARVSVLAVPVLSAGAAGTQSHVPSSRCRIPEKNFRALKERLQQWAIQWIAQLPDASADIRSLSETERTRIGNAYEGLLRLGAGLHFQDTAAAKTLHALRPGSLPMWDVEIKNRFIRECGVYKRTAGQIYSNFGLHVAQKIAELEADVKRLGYSLSDVPRLVQCPDFSLVKLVDKYHWIAITSAHQAPRRDELEQWLHWESGSAGATAGQ
jgi:hypothetical protein